MTEITNKYHNGKIYTIRSHKTDKFYIGSTVQPLHKRLHGHRCNYKLYKEGKGNNISSFIILEHDDNYIELLETFKCESKYELEKREGELIRLHRDNCINRYIVGRTSKEYYEDNRDNVLERVKKYYEDNHDDKLEYANEYRKNNRVKISKQHKTKITCSCGSITNYGHKARHEQTEKHLSFIKSIVI
jgi:hypothetical protein